VASVGPYASLHFWYDTFSIHHVCHDIGYHVSNQSFFSANIESQRTLSVRYFTTLSQQLLTDVIYVTYQKFCFQQGSTLLARHSCNTVKLQESELSASLLLIMAINLTAQQWSLMIMRSRDSHISMSISCESTRLKKSSSDWLKSREVGYSIRVKICDFVLFCFTR